MPSEIIQRMQSVTSIEEIDTEVTKLSAQQREIENEKAALLDLREVLVTAKEGKPAKAYRRKRGAITLTAAATPESVNHSTKADATKAAGPQVWDNENLALGERVRAYLKYFGEATVTEISRALRVPYGTAYSHLKKSTDIDKTGEFYSLMVND